MYPRTPILCKIFGHKERQETFSDENPLWSCVRSNCLYIYDKRTKKGFYFPITKGTKKKYYNGVKHYFQFNHIQKLLVTDIRTAQSHKEMISLINDSLKNPDIDRERAKRVVRQQCWKLDGKSSERLGDFILKELYKT